MNGDENLIISPPGWRSRDVFLFGQRISDPIDQSEAATTTVFRISTLEAEEGFFSTENQNGDGFG